MQKLFEIYTEAGEDWHASSLVQHNSRTEECARSGQENYRTFRSLVQEHGQTNAENLRRDKKAKQAKSGDAYEDTPWWMTHPDFPTLEVIWLQLLVYVHVFRILN